MLRKQKIPLLHHNLFYNAANKTFKKTNKIIFIFFMNWNNSIVLLFPAGRRLWSGDYKIPSMHAYVHLSRSYIKLYILVIYDNKLTKFAGSVYCSLL